MKCRESLKGRRRPSRARAAVLLAAVVALIPAGASAGVVEEFSLAARPDGGAWASGISGVSCLSAASAVRPFSLSPSWALSQPRAGRETATLPVVSARLSAPMVTGSATGITTGTVDAGRKRPWLAGFEVFNFNMGLWVYSRYVAKEDWAYISWETIKANFRNGFEYDDDGFFTNFFMHPYHGSVHYNAARSLGMTYLESSLYTLGGSLMWEMFLENQYPSTNDLIMTATGGVYAGEFFYRMSSLILDDTATGVKRTWREIFAFLVNPMRGLNRLIYGDVWRTSDVNRQIRAPVEGHVALTSTFVVNRTESSGGAAGTAFELDFIYGQRFSGVPERKPFDMILFTTGLRMAGSQTYFNIDTHALIWGKERGNGKGRSHLFGLFQNYDFLNNEEIAIGGTSLAGGVLSFFPLIGGGKLELRTSAQLGAMLFGAADNRYPLVTGNEYHYGMGPIAKFDARLAHRRWGWLSLRFNHYQNYAMVGKNSADRRSHDFLSVLKAQYGVAIRKGLGVRIEHATYLRRTYFEGYAPINVTMSHLGLSLILGFS